MKYRFIAYLTTAICFIGTVGCGDNTAAESTASSPNQTESSETASTVINNEKDASFLVTYQLTDKIPAEAVTKVTMTELENNEEKDSIIEYRDEHDNVLVRIIDAYTHELPEITLNSEYKYNDNGDNIYERDLTSHTEREFFREYDGNNRLIKEKQTSDGRTIIEVSNEYDEFGNILKCHTIYYSSPGEVMTEYLEDNSDCDYDTNGNMLTVRRRNLDTHYMTSVYTYDEGGNILTEKSTGENYNSENIDYKFIETRYEYDYGCGKPTLEEKSYLKEDGSVLRSSTIKHEYDSNGRVIKTVMNDSDFENEDVLIYEYEDL